MAGHNNTFGKVNFFGPPLSYQEVAGRNAQTRLRAQNQQLVDPTI